MLGPPVVGAGWEGFVIETLIAAAPDVLGVAEGVASGVFAIARDEPDAAVDLVRTARR